MTRLRMNDKQWQRIQPMIPDGKPGGRPPLDRRTIIDGILWILRTGAPWRDIPEAFGKLPRTLTMAKPLEEIKKPSSIWMKQQERGIAHFAWQAGYGIFSVGQSQLPGLLQYIDNPLLNKIQRAGFF